MQSKDKKQYKRTCYGCHLPQGKAAFSEALKKQTHNNFPELYCNKCLKARRLSVRNEVIDFSVEDNYVVMKLAPSQYCEPFMPFSYSVKDTGITYSYAQGFGTVRVAENR